MADSSQLLASWVDPVLGELVWEGTGWGGTVEISGRRVRLWLDPDRATPTRQEQLAVIAASSALLAGVRKVEPEFRRRLAHELAQAVGSQATEEVAAEAVAAVDELVAALELEEVSLHGSGELHYHDGSGKFFPSDELFTVYFSEDLTYDEM
ncbi:MAG: hypothetical protein JO316_15570 [Abitibacteriaceae bacterium]|nr:hypothetical protein [Abditibacteriaceae bacterium]